MTMSDVTHPAAATSAKIAFALAVVLMLPTGCSSSSHSPLGTVSGTVTLDAQPLADAKIRFSTANSRPGTATTDASGRYELR